MRHVISSKYAAGLAVVLLMSSLAACGGSQTADSAPKVVATAYPLFEATASIGGKYVHAVDLLPLDPLAPLTAKQADELRSAPLAIVLGQGTQPEVDKVVAQRSGRTVNVLDSINNLSATTADVGRRIDLHAWQNPQNMGQISEQVERALRDLVPADDTKFAGNAARYQRGLADVDREYARVMSTCKRRELMTDNPKFAYLTDRFGIRQVQIAPVVGGDDAALRAAVAQYRPTTVFSATLPSVADASRVLDTYGVRVAVLDPLATRTDQARRGGASYGVVMRLNLDALREALGCEPKRT